MLPFQLDEVVSNWSGTACVPVSIFGHTGEGKLRMVPLGTCLEYLIGEKLISFEN